MSDEVTKLEVTPEQIEAVKRNLIANFLNLYHTFIEGVKSFPCHPAAKQNALIFFDTGCVWYKEAIASMAAENISIAPLDPVPQAPVQTASEQESNVTLDTIKAEEKLSTEIVDAA